jgi:ribosomal protein L11 methyltransferase
MEWLEVSVNVDNEAAEAVAEVFARYAYHGVVIEAHPEHADPVVVRAYLAADEQLRDNKRRVEEALWHLGQIWPIPEPSFRPIAEADWAEAWKEQLRVLHVGHHIVIRPSWLDYTPASEDIVIDLDPGMAFGTGLHPTTQLCLEALERLVQPGARVLDLGTGSGILAIAAAKLDAGAVTAVDNDPVAAKTARENVSTNGVREIVTVVKGSLGNVAGRYDLVLANILAQVIVEMLQEGLGSHVEEHGGKLVATGIITGQEAQVDEALEQGRLTPLERQQKGDWICLVAERA